MEDFIQRVIEEKKELTDKINKLVDFMHSDKFSSLEAVDQGLLMVQLEAMHSYHRTLGRRIERLTS